jgi:hypothetical protein
MLDGFHLATEQEITTRKSVVYLIAFDDSTFYIGSTSQTFRRRYGTISLRDSHLVANSTIQRKLDDGVDYKVFFHSITGLATEARLAFEFSLIEQNIRSPLCLNLRTENDNFGSYHACSLKSPEGVVIDFESVKQARDFIGASNHSQISQVINGRMLSACGWTLPETTGPVGSAVRKKKCVLLDPAGNAMEFASYGDAALAIGVSQNNIASLVECTVTTLKGWTIPGKPSRKYIPLKLLSPHGEVMEFPSRLQASKFIGCCNQLVSSLCSGKVKTAKGWALAEAPRMREGR